MNTEWPRVKLGEVLTPVSRPEPVHPTRTYRILGAHWYAGGLFTKDVKPGSGIQAKEVYRVEEGDFVYNRLFAWKGSFALVTEENAGCYVSNEFPCFAIRKDRADSSYLWRYFSRASVWEEAFSLSTGGTPTSRNRLKEEKLLAMEIPLPSLEEQRRIVARIEELAAKIEEAGVLRQHAIAETGALPRGCSEEYYKRLWIQFGQLSLGDFCESITDGDHNTPEFAEEGVRFIFVGNVSSGRLHFDGCKHVAESYFRRLKPQRIPERGDILYSAVGATLGIPAVVDRDEPFCIQRHVAILKPKRAAVDSRFVWHMLRSRSLFEKAWSSTTGSAQPTVPLRAIRELTIPIPPVAEQRRMALELDAHLVKADELKDLQAEMAAELDALLPSILDKAFKGEL